MKQTRTTFTTLNNRVSVERFEASEIGRSREVSIGFDIKGPVPVGRHAFEFQHSFWFDPKELREFIRHLTMAAEALERA